jgi:hypothetical protein
MAELTTLPESNPRAGRPGDVTKRIVVLYAAAHFLLDRQEKPTPTVGNEFERLLSILWELVSGERDQSLRAAARDYWFSVVKAALKPKPGLERGVS